MIDEKTGWTEADITINGQQLSFAESLTLRVAIGSFQMGLTADGLGDDQHGKAMVESYLAHTNSITEKIFAVFKR